MGWLKRDLLTKAYSELALAGYAFDLEPEELQDSAMSLDTMLAEWDARGIKLGYPFPDDPTSDLDVESNVPFYAVRAVYMNLAIAIATGKGKAVSQPQAVIAKQGYDLLLSKAAMPSPTQYPSTLPMGAGNKRWRGTGRVFSPEPDTGPLGTTPGGDLDFLEP